jgi:signal transduction histidine kinase
MPKLPTEVPQALATAAPSTAWLAVQRRMRQHLMRSVLVMLTVCLGIAVLLRVLDGGRFHYKLIYSLCIGCACMLAYYASYLAAAWLHDRLRASRGLSPDPGPFARGWGGVVLATATSVVLGPPLGQWVADAITGFSTPGVFDLTSSNARITMLISLMATALLVTVLSSLERLATARADAEAAQRLAAEHQLRLLQSQLEPHMLFNTLANLRVLIGLDAAQAQAMLDRLIAYLRATLNASRLSSHALATEFDRINDYLALMAVRMGPRLRVQLDLPAELRPLPVPPLLLQPLVENAIKHGLEPHVEGGLVTVSALAERGELVLTVRDTGAGLRTLPSAEPGTQFGLAQVRERLATLHGPAATLTLQSAPDAQGGTLATIRLPLPSSMTLSAAATARPDTNC